jgi:3-methyladenine DNA glycosylase AlkD
MEPLNVRKIVQQLRSLRNERNIKGMARFGIRGKNILGIPKPKLASMARAIGKNHDLALELWDTQVHEARILAVLIDEPRRVTSAQMEKWVKGFDSWDICDCCCCHLFDRTPRSVQKARLWSRRKREYEKRAGFVLMAAMAVHDKNAPDALFLSFLPLIRGEAWDERNFVKKAVNWALRQIGKRNPRLRKAAIREAQILGKKPFPSARWIAADALRELRGIRR